MKVSLMMVYAKWRIHKNTFFLFPHKTAKLVQFYGFSPAINSMYFLRKITWKKNIKKISDSIKCLLLDGMRKTERVRLQVRK